MLIKCPDCGRDVSDQAPSCIGCGRPIRPAEPVPVTTYRYCDLNLRLMSAGGFLSSAKWIVEAQAMDASGLKLIAGVTYRSDTAVVQYQGADDGFVTARNQLCARLLSEGWEETGGGSAVGGMSLPRFRRRLASAPVVAVRPANESRPSVSPTQALLAKGREALDANRPEDAIAAFNELLELRPDAEVLRLLARAHMKAFSKREGGELNVGAMTTHNRQALAALGRSLELRPDDPDTLYDRACCLLVLHPWQEAVDAFGKYIALRPKDPAGYVARGDLLKDNYRREEAVTDFRRALSLSPDNLRAAEGVADCLYELERRREALEAYRFVSTLKPEHSEARERISVCLYGLGQYEQALAAADEALRVTEDPAQMHSWRGEVLEQLGRNEEALAAYDRSLQINPDNGYVSMSRAIVQMMLGHPDTALGDFEKAVASGRARFNPYLAAETGLVGCLVILGRNEEAVTAAKKALEVVPQENPDIRRMIYLDFAKALRNLNRAAEALELFDEAMELGPNAEMWRERGECLCELGRAVEAIADYDRALELDPEYADALHSRGWVQLGLKRWEDALATYDRLALAQPDHEYASCGRGRALVQLGRLAEAMEAYDHHLSLRPDDPVALSGRAVCLDGLGQHDEAIVTMRRAIALDPSEARYPWTLGVTFEQAGRREEALDAYRSALEVAIGDKVLHPAILHSLGNCLRNLGRFDEAYRAYSNLSLEQDDDVGTRGMTACLALDGRFEESLELACRELVRYPESSGLLYAQACALARLGRLASAMDALSASLGLDSSRCEQARTDPDFEALRSDSAYKAGFFNLVDVNAVSAGS